MGKIGETSPDRNSSLGLDFYSILRFLSFSFQYILRAESFKYSECFTSVARRSISKFALCQWTRVMYFISSKSEICLLETLLKQWYRALVARAICFEHRSAWDRTVPSAIRRVFYWIAQISCVILWNAVDTPHGRWISVSGTRCQTRTPCDKC